MKIVNTGASRIVFIVGRWCIKIPRITNFTCFLYGLLGNMQEVSFSKTGHQKVCPIVIYIPFGLLVVMPKCKILTEMEWKKFPYLKFVEEENIRIPAEEKRDSFAWYKDSIVAIDYGGMY